MYDYKALLVAFLFVNLDGFELRFGKLKLSDDLLLKDIIHDENQIRFNARLMKTALMAMKIEYDPSLINYHEVLNTLDEQDVEGAKEVLSFLLD